MSGKIKKTFFALVKCTVAAAIIILLVRSGKLERSAFEKITLDAANISLIVAAAIAMAIGLVLLGLRLHIVLKFCQVPSKFTRAFGITAVSSFFGSVLPGLIGSDVVTAVYLCSGAPETTASALTVIIFNRVIGVYALFLIGAIASFIAWATGAVAISGYILLICPAAVAALTLMLLALSFERTAGVLSDVPVLKLIIRKLDKFFVVTRSCLRNPKLIAQCLVLAVANHLCVIVTFVAAGILLKSSLDTFSQMVISPIAMSANMIPLTPGGLGIAETAFSVLFDSAGASGGAAVGMLGRLLQYIIFAVAGLICFMSLKLKHVKEAEEEKAYDSALSG